MSIVAVEGERGGGTCYKVACALSEHYSFKEALLILKCWNIVRAKPRFPESQLIHKLTDAFNRDCVQQKIADGVNREQMFEDQAEEIKQKFMKQMEQMDNCKSGGCELGGNMR